MRGAEHGYCSLALAPPPPRRHNKVGLAAWLLALLLGAALILAPSAGAQTTTDYDDDDDGLIDVRSLAQLNAIRYDLDGDGDPSSGGSTAYGNAFSNRVTSATGRMGCPATGGCTGYELRADLTFDENGDGQITMAGDPTYWNSGSGWEPINLGGAAFRGNGHTISHLYVNRASSITIGLFGDMSTGSSIEGVGIVHADVTGRNHVGVAVGFARGSVTKVYVTGRVSGAGWTGGLAGTSRADIRASWSTASVHSTTISNTGAGGLVGYNDRSINASWSAGRVVASATRGGGLAGGKHTAATVTDSYWDMQTSGWTTSPGGGTGKTTRELQRPTAYGSSGIYANWNLNLDGQAGGDDPWDFGTSRQYPALKFADRTTYRAPPGSRPTTGTPPSWANPSSPASAARPRAPPSRPPPRSPPATA